MSELFYGPFWDCFLFSQLCLGFFNCVVETIKLPYFILLLKGQSSLLLVNECLIEQTFFGLISLASACQCNFLHKTSEHQIYLCNII